MARIDSNHDLAALIRRQVSSLGGASAASRAVLEGPSGRRVAPSKQAGGDGAADVAALIARRIRSIDSSDPDRHRKAFRVYLESVLLHEFGDHLINDSGFQQLVEEVHVQMAADPDLAKDMLTATTRMLESSDKGRRPATVI